MRRIVPLLVLAGCSSQGSLEVVVTAPAGTPVTKVELYVGYSGQHDEAIRPKDGELAPTVWWKRDENPGVDIEEVRDGRATFAFLPDGQYNGVAALVAVGYAEDGLPPVGLATRLAWTDIPDNEIHRYELELGAFEALPRPSPSNTSLPGLRIWGPDDRPRACVQVDNVPDLMMPEYADRETGALPESGMIVTPADWDCDGLRKLDDPTTNKECFEYEYMAQAAMSRDSLRCAIAERVIDPLENITYVACVAGGATCADGTGQSSTTCSPSSYCIPSALCCADAQSCDPYRTDVALEAIPYIKCELAATLDAGVLRFCPNVSATFDVRAALDEPLLQCDELRGAKLRRGLAGTWVSKLLLPTTTPPGTLGELHVTSPSECMLQFDGYETVPPSSTGNNIIRAALSVPLEGRGLMLPILFAVTTYDQFCPDNDVVLPCFIDEPSGGTDHGLEACLGAPVFPGREVLD